MEQVLQEGAEEEDLDRAAAAVGAAAQVPESAVIVSVRNVGMLRHISGGSSVIK